MPLFSKSKKRKPEWKPGKHTSNSPSQPLYLNAVYQAPPYVPTQNSPWQSPPFAQSQYFAPHPPTQMVPYQYPVVPAHASSAYLPPPTPYPPAPPKQNYGQQMKWNSCQNLSDTLARPCQVVSATVDRTTDYLNRGAALCDQVASKFNDVISLMDEEVFTGNEQDLRLTYYQPPHAASPRPAAKPAIHGRPSKALIPTRKNAASTSDGCPMVQKALTTSNVFAKANMYANSRLPSDLRPFCLYIATWPLICLAAQYSLHAYRKPLGAEKDEYVDADWRVGTKAMVIKSVPIENKNVIVFAIRGTQTFMDWAVNLNTATVSPAGFLDDPGNLCHAGFLDVARKMIKPVALRLKQLLKDNPRRSSCSLIITGHSAGGAVASLLFCHILGETVTSELKDVTRRFKRVHCITFGAPPVSLLPLSKPAGQEGKLEKHQFLSFINEGDPVTRADKAYVQSLLELYGSPPPTAASHMPATSNNNLKLASKPKMSSGFWNNMSGKRPKLPTRPTPPPPGTGRPYSNLVWKVPSATLSNAGRLVLLRTPWNGRNEDVEACTTTDEQLRGVVFGDPLMHQMKVYARRVEMLASQAVTGRLMT